VRKFSNLTDESNLLINDNKTAETKSKTIDSKTSAVQVTTKTKTKEEEPNKEKAANDCAINTDGK